MCTEVFCIISFDTSHQAIVAEMAVSGLPNARLVPLPPEISEGCGLALRVNKEDTDKAVELLQKKRRRISRCVYGNRQRGGKIRS